MAGYEKYSNPVDGTEIESYFTAPAGRRSPAVIILRGVAGPDSGYTQIADALAGEGFAALVHRWQVRGDDPDDDVLIGDIRAALAFLRSRPEVDADRIAVFGYCKGGGQALLAAAELDGIHAIVAFHGFAKRPNGADPAHADPIAVVERLGRPVLLLHGEQDQLSPLPSMKELAVALQGAGCPGGIHIYPGADHGFAVSTHKGFKPDAASDGFKRGVSFLRENMA